MVDCSVVVSSVVATPPPPALTPCLPLLPPAGLDELRSSMSLGSLLRTPGTMQLLPASYSMSSGQLHPTLASPHTAPVSQLSPEAGPQQRLTASSEVTEVRPGSGRGPLTPLTPLQGWEPRPGGALRAHASPPLLPSLSHTGPLPSLSHHGDGLGAARVAAADEEEEEEGEELSPHGMEDLWAGGF